MDYLRGRAAAVKTHLALELLKYLCGFVDRAAYDTLEQGLSLSFQNAWKNARNAGGRLPGYRAGEKNRSRSCGNACGSAKSPNVIVIDSITALVGFTRTVFMELINEFPDKLFIFIAHEENNKPYPAIAQHVRKLSEVKIRVEGYKGFVTTRFKGEKGEGGADFVIWEQGANEYWIDKL